MDKGVILDWFQRCSLVEHYLVALGRTGEAEVDSVCAVVGVQSQSSVARVVGDPKRSVKSGFSEGRVFVGKMRQVETMVGMERLTDSLVEVFDVFL